MILNTFDVKYEFCLSKYLAISHVPILNWNTRTEIVRASAEVAAYLLASKNPSASTA